MYQVPNHETQLLLLSLFQFAIDLTSLLEQHISKEFDTLIKVTSPLNDNQLPLNLFDKNRRQWKSDDILLWLKERKLNEVLRSTSGEYYCINCNEMSLLN